jgi:lipoprotein-releasing system ATP-binding protein
MNDLLKINGLEKSFKQGGNALTVFKDLSLHVTAGEIVALVGQSGSGKSTLLQIAGLLDRPSAGLVTVFGNDAAALSEKRRTEIRAGGIGFVYQFHHLLPEFSALENVAMGAIVSGVSIKDAKDKAAISLEALGLGKRFDHRPGQLSGGEQQRVAIARALVNDPFLLLADEPTGNLDPSTSEEVFAILLEQARKRQMGALIATHNHSLAARMDRMLELKNGKIV